MDGGEPKQYAGTISGHDVSITDKTAADELHSDGYGERDGVGLVLAPHEALYLMYRKTLAVTRKHRAVSFDSFMREQRRLSGDALVRFLIYRDLRTRGYTVRNGFGFGSDFCVYERGDYGKKGAKYLVFGFSDGKPETAGALQKKIVEITQMGKEPIIAVVDGRGEVIYYKITPATFATKSRGDASLQRGGPRRRVL